MLGSEPGRQVRRRAAVFVLVLAAAFMLFSCHSFPGGAKAPELKAKAGGLKIALVLGGGAAKGFAHVGVIRVLEQEKIPIHMIVGTSVGSLIGAMYAANPDSFQLEWTAFRIERGDILDVSLVNSKWGPVQGVRLEALVDQTVKVKTIEETRIPFYPVATDINTGETVTLEKGPIAKAVRASSAIPGIFVPVNFGKRLLVDGGVTDNVPCDIARNKGADIVIAVNLSNDVKEYNMTSLIDIIGQSANIMMHDSCKTKLQYADVVIEPDSRGVSMFDFTQKKVLMEEGIKAARKAVPRIREIIAKYQAS